MSLIDPKFLNYAVMEPRSNAFEMRQEPLWGPTSQTDSERLAAGLHRIVGGGWTFANGILPPEYRKPFGIIVCEDAVPRGDEFNVPIRQADGGWYPIFGRLVAVRLHSTEIRSLRDGDPEKLAASPVFPPGDRIPHGDDATYWGMMRSLGIAAGLGIEVPDGIARQER